MNYPLISEYIEAIKSAEDNFEELSYLRPVLGGDGLPVMTSGNFAVVFKMKDEQSGKYYAVKCFTKEQEGRAEAYREIAKELENVSSPYILSIQYLDKELFVDTDQTTETEFPVLLMDWVEGRTLDKYLRENLDNKYALKMLVYRFRQLFQWLIPQSFAHGDLKPDNILVKQDGSLVLVDYDGMFVPSMRGEKRRELGSPDFQNPHKAVERFDENMDVFSLISIFLSLSIVAYDSDTLVRFGAADRLLFSVNDYLDIQQSKLYNYIICSFPSNGKTRKLTEVLYKLCKGEPISLFLLNNVRRVLTSDIVCPLNRDSDLPSAEEYINAISNFTFYFRTLEHLTIITENNRITYIKGTNSVVFKMRDEHTGKYYAIKCHTDTKYDIYNRLEVIKEKLYSIESPYFVNMQIFYNEININDNNLIGEGSRFYPVVLMDWVEGVTMEAFVLRTDTSKEDLKKMIDSYKVMSSWLLARFFSHGDVSPKNIIITKDNKTILIDYDNMVFNKEDNVPELVKKLKDEDFCSPFQMSYKYEDNVDVFSLVSIMISLIYRFECISRPNSRYNYYGHRYFFNKEDYANLDESDLYKRIDQCYSFDYELSAFCHCLKQQLRSVCFSKEEINFLFKDKLPKREDSHHYRYEGPNGKLEKHLVKFASAYSVLTLIVPFLLISYTQLNLLGVSIVMLVLSIIIGLLLFLTASFRPEKNSKINIGDDDYVGFGCLGSFGTFMPVLFMSDFVKDIVNNHISWLHIPAYDEPWYITVAIWVVFFLSNQIFLSLFMGDVYDYDTLKYDVNNKRYLTKRKKFINRLHEDEYNYKNSKDFQDSRLLSLICINVLALLLFIYTLYCFFFQHLDLIYTNIIIALVSLGTSLLIQPILKNEYAVYSHKLTKMYWNINLIKVFLPMITIPFAFSGFTDFLNSIFSISIPPYELGTKEFIINTFLYILIYFSPFIKENYV